MIEVRNLSKYFGETTALCDVSIKLIKGQNTIISGQSGSGKTTLLRILAGLERPDNGEVYLDGELASSSTWVKAPYERNLGFVFQTNSLWPHMTVAQNLAYGICGPSKTVKKARLDEVLEQSGLRELSRRYPHQLSGGQARRAALARSLAPCPKILLLDEPLIYLDPETRSDMVAWLQAETHRHQMTVVWVTHNLKEIDGISEHYYRMEQGRLNEDIMNKV